MIAPGGNGRPEYSNDELMRAMGSKKGGWDAFPPDQYLFFKESKDRYQKALAFIRSRTLGHGHKSPFMVNEDGNAIGLAGFAELAGLPPGHASEVLDELERDGLIRRENRGNGGLRIYLCAEVTPVKRTQDEKDKGKISRIPCIEFLADYQLNEFNKLTPDLQIKANAKIMDFEEWADDVEAEVMAAARLKTNAKREQVYLEFGLPVRKLKPVPNKREKPRRCAVQIELFAESGQAEDADSVQGNHDSVQSAAEAPEALYRAPDDDVQSASGGLSINTDADLRSVSVGQSSAAPETDRPTDPPPSVEAARYEAIEAAITPASEKVQDPVTPKIVKAIDRKLCGAPVENLVARIKVRWSAITSLAFVRDHLADDVGKIYREAERKAKARATGPAPTEEELAAMEKYEDELRKKLAEPVPKRAAGV